MKREKIEETILKLIDLDIIRSDLQGVVSAKALEIINICKEKTLLTSGDILRLCEGEELKINSGSVKTTFKINEKDKSILIEILNRGRR